MAISIPPLPLAGVDLNGLAKAVNCDLRAAGVTFGTPGDGEFRVDPLPRVIDAEEWRALASGLVQRVRALERFVADVYSEQRIVADGVVPAAAIANADHFEPQLRGIGLAPRIWIALAGLDVVRDGDDGAFKVLEDNVRTPSGLAYAVATRDALSANLRAPAHWRVQPIEQAFALLETALRSAAPPGVDDPTIVVLSDGAANSAYYEHRTIARKLGLALLTPADLVSRGDRLLARIDGRLVPVHVVYRRTDEDRLFDPSGEPTAVGSLLLEPWRSGNIACVNAYGTGVADDKLLHSYVEAMIGYYLGEEPLLESVPTYDLTDPSVLAMVLERVDELVIKPRSGHGGVGVVVCPHAEPADVAATAAAIRRDPHGYVAQEMVALSREPTVVAGEVEPRHVDLRPFVISRGSRIDVVPGGLTRVAFQRDALVVNSSQDGGAKDTWVLD